MVKRRRRPLSKVATHVVLPAVITVPGEMTLFDFAARAHQLGIQVRIQQLEIEPKPQPEPPPAKRTRKDPL